MPTPPTSDTSKQGSAGRKRRRTNAAAGNALSVDAYRATMSEADFQTAIENDLDQLGAKWFHDPGPYRCRRCHLLNLDNRRKGFADILAVTGETLRYWELKSKDGKMGLEQAAWMIAVRGCSTIDARILRPADLAGVRHELGL